MKEPHTSNQGKQFEAFPNSDDEIDDPFSGIPASNSSTTQHFDTPIELEGDDSVVEPVEGILPIEHDYETENPTSSRH